MFEDLLRRWDGEHAVVRHDAETGAWIFVCIHSTRLGPAMGGTRLKAYATAGDALEDGLRLAAGMTRKLAVLGLPCGGGKAVLAVPATPGRRRAAARCSSATATWSSRSAAATSPARTSNTGEADMDVIGARTSHVFCRSVDSGGSGDPSIHTALGVFHGIRATLAHAFGIDDLTGRTVLVQGTGCGGREAGAAAAGRRCGRARQRRRRGAGACDRRAARAADTALELECDVYAPCALGATLNADSIPRLRCRIVAGAANNQLATAEDGERLRAAGILYAPDYVINGGGALHGIGLERLGWDADRVEREVAGIGDTLAGIYRTPTRPGSRRTTPPSSSRAERLDRDGNRPQSALASRRMARWSVLLARPSRRPGRAPGRPTSPESSC